MYTYTFDWELADVTDPLEVSFDEDDLHRVAIQFSYGDLRYNPYYDWVPSGGTAPATRSIVTIDSCNECHGTLAMHGGGRIDTNFCVTCHNPGTTDANSGNVVDFKIMIHKIHMGIDLPSVDAGEPYVIWGYRDGEHDFSHVGFPQDVNNCIKCHNPDDAETPDASNYLERPTMEACGACHDDVDFATGDGHTGGEMEDNSTCAMCHEPDDIESYHVSENATENNPGLPDGLSVIEYELVSASVDSSNVLTIEFRITQDGTEIDVTDLPEDLAAPGWYPGFKMAWAEPQSGIDAPTDWNNLGNEAGQPSGFDLDDIMNGDPSGASITYSGGINTAVIPDAFPEAGMMRSVALQGYFQQEVDGENVSRHAVSAVITVDGDDERRQVVDASKCTMCHEWFEEHGGNRVIGPESELVVCVFCHMVNHSSSSREIDLDYPEASMNLKDLVHGIHGASARDYPLDFVRNRSGGTRYTFLGSADQLAEYPDGHVITFPNDPNNCTVCHLDDTYRPEEVSGDALPSTVVTGGDAVDEDQASDARETVPNDDDWVNSPIASACTACHNGALDEAHMQQNGGAIEWSRAEYVAEGPTETCAICHGEGRVADVSEMHGVE